MRKLESKIVAMRLLVLISSLLMFSCTFSTNEEAKKKKTLKKFRNNIDVKTKGIKLDQIYLAFDDGTLVPEGNQVSLNQKVNLHLICKEGWSSETDRVSLGASQKVTTETGTVLIDNKDLFNEYGDVSKEDSKLMRLSIKPSAGSGLFDRYIVQFRIWNKKTDEEVTGKYELNLRE